MFSSAGGLFLSRVSNIAWTMLRAPAFMSRERIKMFLEKMAIRDQSRPIKTVQTFLPELRIQPALSRF